MLMFDAMGVSDGGVFKNSTLYKALETKALQIPPPRPLPRRDKHIPFTILADDAFPLKEYIMKPYSQTGLTPESGVFKYCLSCARRTVENAFGIFISYF